MMRFKASKADKVTRKWWFYVGIILLMFIPSVSTRNFSMEKSVDIANAILSNSISYNMPDLVYVVFNIIPMVLVGLLILYGNRFAKLFNVYVGISYILFAFGQNIAFTEKYGTALLTFNFLVFLLVAFFWFWEVKKGKNDYSFACGVKGIKGVMIIPIVFIVFWYPFNFNVMQAEFNPLFLFTNSSGLSFCVMTPVYLTLMLLNYPRVNLVLLRVTSFIGILLAYLNYQLLFFVDDSWVYWHVTLHTPLLVLSICGLVLSLRKNTSVEGSFNQEYGYAESG